MAKGAGRPPGAVCLRVLRAQKTMEAKNVKPLPGFKPEEESVWGYKSSGTKREGGMGKWRRNEFKKSPEVKKKKKKDSWPYFKPETPPLIFVHWHLVVSRWFINPRHAQITALTVLLISVTLLDTNDWVNKLHFQQQPDIRAETAAVPSVWSAGLQNPFC